MKQTTKTMACITIVMLLILVVGCTPSIVYVDRNNTIYKDNIIYINNTINNTMPGCDLNASSNYNRDYVLNLIRQIKRCEANQDKFFNSSDCEDELNQTEHRLEQAENELCDEWNSSWC